MNANYMKLQLIEGLIVQITDEQMNCGLTQRSLNELYEMGTKVNDLMTLFEEGDRETKLDPVDHFDQEKSSLFVAKILDELRKVQ